MRNHTDTQLVSDVNLLGAVTWRRWPRPEVIEAGEVLFREGSAGQRSVLDLDGVIKLVTDAATLGLRRGRSLLGPFIAGHPPITGQRDCGGADASLPVRGGGFSRAAGAIRRSWRARVRR